MGSSPESVFQIDNDTIILDNNQYRLVRTPISHVRVVPQSYIRVVQSAPNKSNLINGFVVCVISLIIGTEFHYNIV